MFILIFLEATSSPPDSPPSPKRVYSPRSIRNELANEINVPIEPEELALAGNPLLEDL